MVNEVNRETVQYWQDEEENCRLNFLLTQERLMRLLNKSDEVREIFVFSFTHLHSDKVYFYSASFEELLQKDILLKVFLGFGSKKGQLESVQNHAYRHGAGASSYSPFHTWLCG